VLFSRKGVYAFFLSSLTLIIIIVMEVKWLGVVVITQKMPRTTTTPSEADAGLGEGARVKSVQ